MLARNRERLRHVRRFHEPETEQNTAESRGHRFDVHAIFIANARRGGVLDGEDDVLLMQHLVML